MTQIWMQLCNQTHQGDKGGWNMANMYRSLLDTLQRHRSRGAAVRPPLMETLQVTGVRSVPRWLLLSSVWPLFTQWVRNDVLALLWTSDKFHVFPWNELRRNKIAVRYRAQLQWPVCPLEKKLLSQMKWWLRGSFTVTPSHNLHVILP